MSGSTTIIANEKGVIERRFSKAYDRLMRIAKEGEASCELACRMLTSRVLSDAGGGLRDVGFPEFVTSSHLVRMEGVAQFIGYHMRDDGDPGLCWHRFRDDMLHDERFEDCLEADEGAMPYFRRIKETREDELGVRIPRLTEQQVIQTLDWHERDSLELSVALDEEKEHRELVSVWKIGNRALYELADEFRDELHARLALNELFDEQARKSGAPS